DAEGADLLRDEAEVVDATDGAFHSAADGDAADLREEGVRLADLRNRRVVAGAEKAVGARDDSGDQVARDPVAADFHFANLGVGIREVVSNNPAGDQSMLDPAADRQAFDGNALFARHGRVSDRLDLDRESCGAK